MYLTNSHEALAFDPLRLAGRSVLTKVVFVLAGTLALAIASQIAVPMVPVPITMQTFAVTMIGVLYGWRLGVVTVLAWLGEAMLGAPVLAGGAGGIAPFMGATAGYLFPSRWSPPQPAGLPNKAGPDSALSPASRRIWPQTSCA